VRLRELEDVRQRFLPERVTVLFVGESPPAGGTFFYLANSKLYEATKEAFIRAAPDLVRGSNFLERFAALGCYLDDLCLEPVNHLKMDNPLAEAKRLRLREEGEEPLASRIRQCAPSAIVVVMKGIEANVRRAATSANFSSIVIPALPFPSWKAHREQYVDELSNLVRSLRGRGLLRATPIN
jgi:hypothetical protein